MGEALGRRQRESEGGRMGERVITQRGPVTAEARQGMRGQVAMPTPAQGLVRNGLPDRAGQVCRLYSWCSAGQRRGGGADQLCSGASPG